FRAFTTSAFGTALLLLLCLGFFHGLARLFGFFGAKFGSLLALFVQNFFRAQQFDKCLLSAIALLEAGANDAQIASIAVTEPRTDRIEQLVHRLARHQETRREPAC